MSPVVHPLSGFLPSVTVFGAVIPVYFVVTALAFVAALLLLVRRADTAGLSRNRALDVALVLMISGFLGSRLFHVFFEEPAYYWQSPWRVFDFWRGGFVWYGGAVFGAACALGFLVWRRERVWPWLDLFAPVCALGYTIGRMACVLTGCCYGRAFSYGGELYQHPTQAYAVVWELCALAVLLWVERRAWVGGRGAAVVGARGAAAAGVWSVFARRPGSLFLLWLGLHACGRIVMEAFRDDPRGPSVLGLSVSTVISLGLLVVVASVSLARSRSRA